MYEGYHIVDADGHVYEPVDLWLQRLPARYRDQAPQPGPHNSYLFKDQVYPRNMAKVIDHGPDIMDELIDLENLVTKPVLQRILRENPYRFYGDA